jgi:hypothetical protein
MIGYKARSWMFVIDPAGQMIYHLPRWIFIVVRADSAC